jgi:hypothetical protein
MGHVADAQGEARQREVLRVVQGHQIHVRAAQPVDGVIVQRRQRQPRAGIIQPHVPAGPLRPGPAPVRHPGQVGSRPAAVQPLDESKAAIQRAGDPDPPGGSGKRSLQGAPQPLRVQEVKVTRNGNAHSGGQRRGLLQPLAQPVRCLAVSVHRDCPDDRLLAHDQSPSR